MRVMDDERRKYKRYSVLRNLKIQRNGEKRQKNIVVKEASQTGLKINIDEFISPKSIVKIIFNPDIYEEIKGRVIWIKKLPAKKGFESGVEFVNMDTYLRKQIILELLCWRS